MPLLTPFQWIFSTILLTPSQLTFFYQEAQGPTYPGTFQLVGCTVHNLALAFFHCLSSDLALSLLIIMSSGF